MIKADTHSFSTSQPLWASCRARRCDVCVDPTKAALAVRALATANVGYGRRGARTGAGITSGRGECGSNFDMPLLMLNLLGAQPSSHGRCREALALWMTTRSWTMSMMVLRDGGVVAVQLVPALVAGAAWRTSWVCQGRVGVEWSSWHKLRQQWQGRRHAGGRVSIRLLVESRWPSDGRVR